jgi:hypothetical protein
MGEMREKRFDGMDDECFAKGVCKERERVKTDRYQDPKVVHSFN